MATKKGEENGNSHDVGLGIYDFDSSAVGCFSNEDFGSLNIDDFGGSSVQSDSLDSSDTNNDTQGLDFELNDAESAIVRLVERKIAGPGGRAASAKAEKIYITHEDFDEGDERNAFLLIYGYAEHLFDGPDKAPFDATDLKKTKALRFFFCSGMDEMHLDDAVASIDNQIRVDVLRLRFMFEFWLRDWEMPELPNDADPLPSRVELMAAQCGAMIAVSLAKEAWFHPGIQAAALIELVTENRGEKIHDMVKQSLNDLVCAYVLSISNGKIYTSGKNPVLELEDKLNDPTVRIRGHLANIHWSRKF